MTFAADHDRWADSVAPYLLHALDEREAEGFAEHLAACQVCRDEEARLRVAVDALPASAPPVSPPAELKDRVMRIVRAEAELLQAAGARADVPEPAPRRRRSLRLPRLHLSLRPSLALAATALVVVGMAAGALTSGLLGGGAGGPAARTVAAEVEAPNAKARLVVRGESSTLVATGLPQPDEGRVYQVWIKRPGAPPEPTSALFGVRRDGSASVHVPGRLHGAEAVLVTSEPAGGSTVPTRSPIISAALT